MNNFVIIISFSFIFISCSDIPKCNDEEVKNQTIEKLHKKIKPILVENEVEQNINKEDLQNYAIDKGLDYFELLEQERNEKTKIIDSIWTFNLLYTKIKNIRTVKSEDEIKKCSCVGEIENEFLKPIDIFYSAQKTEDEDGVYIEFNYKLK